MRIVSQNKMLSVNFDNVILWIQDGTIYEKSGTESKPIGNYDSEDRAMEVFQEIHDTYVGVKINVDIVTNGKTGIIVSIENSNESRKDVVGNQIYYMPKE